MFISLRCFHLIKKKVISVHDEVYCEELGSVIDNLVERKEEWTDEQYRTLAMADSFNKPL